MKTPPLILLAALSLGAQAQTPAPKQPTPEQMRQMQDMMAIQMQMQMMAMLFEARPARLGFDETVSAIQHGAAKLGWKVGETRDMQSALRQGGHKDAKRMKLIELCPPGANERLARAGEGKAPALPCRATVFEGKDGKTYVVRMNVAGVAKSVPGALGKAMAEVGAEEDVLYKAILQ